MPAKFDANAVKVVAPPSAAALAIRQRLAAAPPPSREPAVIDFGDGSEPFSVEMVTLLGREKLKLVDRALDAARAAAKAAGRDPEEITNVRVADHTPALIAASMCVPGTDERVLSGPDDELFAMMPGPVMTKLSEIANRLNREEKDAHEDAKNG